MHKDQRAEGRDSTVRRGLTVTDVLLHLTAPPAAGLRLPAAGPPA